MPVTPTYPGVYVQEISSGVRTIVGVSTSTGLFIGRTKKGPLNKPTLCFNNTDFERTFSADNSFGDMARYVRLFFLNGGNLCYIMRIAHGATTATVSLQSEAGTDVLDLTAKNAGLDGEKIRAVVTYNGPQPEATFNLELFTWETNSAGKVSKANDEVWKGLSMDSSSNMYAPTILTQNSKLVDAAVNAGAPAAADGFSQSGRPVEYDSTHADTFRDAWAALLGNTVTTNQFQISVDGNGYVLVNLANIDVAGLAEPSVAEYQTQLKAAIETAINNALNTAGYANVTVTVTFNDGPTPKALNHATSLLCITSGHTGDVFIKPATSNDLAVALMLGTSQGGLEVGAYAALRPAPNGIVLEVSNPAILKSMGACLQSDVTAITLPAVDSSGNPTTVNIPLDLATSVAADPWYVDNVSSSKTGHSDGLREKLGRIRDAVNSYRSSNQRTFFWTAELWGSRLALLPTSGEDNDIGSIAMSPTDLPTTIANSFLENVRYYSVGIDGTAGQQTPAGAIADDGSAPDLADYDAAYEVIDKQVDLFNLMILPPDAVPAESMTDIYGPASIFCQARRAFLLMDPPSAWTTAQIACDGVDSMRIGLVKDYSGIFYPRITIKEQSGKVNIGPAGAIAGLMSRIDSSRGVWKAPAGEEASLLGVVGLEYQFSNKENGVLNPRAINTLRVFPDGIINWGARTMDGDDDFSSEYKYIPIRRLALYMEESLYRGLKWVVFEPNDEPLWAQIRLNVGVFMHNLFRQGAFQGQKPSDAYFVKCDSETTTQNDRDLGIVNILVGFAPLKPAEFVILTLQQIAGQLQT